MFEKIDILKQEFDAAHPLDPQINTLLQERLRIEWTYNSNAIEGNTLTFGETAFFLREGLTSEGKPLKDYLEAQNHAEAIDWLNEIVKNKRPLTESFIKQLHALLLRGIEFTIAKGAHGQLIKKPLTPGTYKTRPNHVLTISGKIHKYVEPIHVKDEMEKLIKFHQNSNNIHPIEKAALFHYKFVTIHPFDDGNGRMARLLMNLILMQHGYPPCIIKNENRRQYLKSLETADTEKDKKQFMEFIAKELIATLQTIVDIIKGKDQALPPYLTGALNRLEREKMILDSIGASTMSIGQIKAKLPQIKRPTLKNDLRNLVKNRSIDTKGTGKGVMYYKTKK